MSGHRLVRAAIIAAAVWACSGSAAPAEAPALEALMTRIGVRIGDYYRRAQRVICVERSTVQAIRSDWTPDGFSRTVESELRVESEAADGAALPSVRVIREVFRVNGRAPRERDRKDRSGCTDPNPFSPEPLAFLLPAHRDTFRFTSVREGRENDRPALVIDFASANATGKPELVEDERGHDDCFDWTGPIAAKGRLWVDAQTDEVLRLDRHVNAPVDVRVPSRLQRRYQFGPWVVIERDDLTMRYKTVAFADPDEVMLLPRSIESVTLVRGGLQSIRRTETYSDYRRFVTAGRVVKDR
jgi:hypothetical protein